VITSGGTGVPCVATGIVAAIAAMAAAPHTARIRLVMEHSFWTANRHEPRVLYGRLLPGAAPGGGFLRASRRHAEECTR
jgi:hypothetical protein